MRRLKFVLGLSLLVFSRAPLRAQILGAASGQFLSRGPGASAAALAGSVVSIVNDPTALYWNPAGIANSNGMISGEHLFLVGGARYDFMGLTVPSDFGSFGLGVIQLARDNIVARSSIDDPGYDISNTQSDYMAGFAKNLGEHWSAGLSANVLDFNLAGYSDLGWGLNGGVMGHYPANDFMGLKRAVWLMGADLDNFVQPQINLAGTPENYPTSLRAGGGLSFQADSRAEASGVINHDRITVLFSVQKNISGENLYPTQGLNALALGVEYNYQNILILRAGFNGALTGGIGLQTEDDRFELDYSIENDPLGFNNRFTLAYRFSQAPSPEKRPEIYREIADEEYVQARTRAQSLAKRFSASGQTDMSREDFSRAKSLLRLASFLNPDNAAMKKDYRQAETAEKIERVQRDEDLLARGLDPQETYQDYAAVFELAFLKPQEQNKWRKTLRQIASNLDAGKCSLISGELFDAEAPRARRWARLGLLEQALNLATALKTIATRGVAAPATADAADNLRREIANKAASLQTRFDWLIKESGASPDAETARTALSVLRAFPNDAGETRNAEQILERYQNHHPLSIREGFYLKKLYYLAAIDFSDKTPEKNAEAEKYLDEILTDNPADENSGALLGALSRRESKQ